MISIVFRKDWSVAYCVFWMDGPHEDVALLYVWLWESDGYAEWD